LLEGAIPAGFVNLAAAPLLESPAEERVLTERSDF
jgi:hypothetical protein